VTELSPAKINLYLKVTGKRRDGYHNLATLFQMVDLCDRLVFTPRLDGEIVVSCSDKKIPQEKNIVYHAAKSLWKKGCPGAEIRIDKKSPSGAGLGGGSSNAATALRVLNRMWRRGLSESALRAMGNRLGADVPFFLFAPRAWATGTGDRLTRLPKAEPFWVVLVKPRISISTPDVYGMYDRDLTNKPRLVNIPKRLKRVVLIEDTVRMLENDLEPLVEAGYPVISRIKSRLKLLKSEGVMVSGSGSSVFGIYRDKRGAQLAKREISKGKWWCAVARTVDSLGQLGQGI